ncbi:predicted protein [Plenodomus lingam JN3]|uniref:Uncharacterized protein n=1 Tax=Leptosphaeria maculans (strain JN3 / isolate v23.1.3 / race Av1-4-5-6-7-8) TaxID=985895 RepID=E5A5W0_LEPMJ|nr:predicted protein [Plenodomus lingam JN3]CBX99005.1 predicted protein [Plenodomus lingam JN3]
MQLAGLSHVFAGNSAHVQHLHLESRGPVPTFLIAAKGF